MSDLMILSGKMQGRVLNLPDREIIVGRDEGCHIRLASSLVSRQHCKISKTPEGIWIEDLGSQNGTFVNDEVISERHLMKPGDTLRIGASQFQVSPIKPAVAKKSKVSDDLISDWLSDSSASSAGGDTTIIRGTPSQAARTPRAVSTRTPAQPIEVTEISTAPVPMSLPEPAAPQSKPAAEPTAGKPTAGKPRSIKEEAAEIIQRYREQKYSRGKPQT